MAVIPFCVLSFDFALYFIISGFEIGVMFVFFVSSFRNFFMNFLLSSFAFDVPSMIRWFPLLWSFFMLQRPCVFFIVRVMTENYLIGIARFVVMFGCVFFGI